MNATGRESGKENPPMTQIDADSPSSVSAPSAKSADAVGPVVTRPLVSCLTATHGRFSVLREALACFMAQDYEPRELIILNHHPTPLKLPWPDACDPANLSVCIHQAGGVTIRLYNEPEFRTPGDCAARLIELARGEFIHMWDDDDLFMPWAISQGVERIGDAPAFKPAKSWGWEVEPDNLKLESNNFESSITIRADVARKYAALLAGGDEFLPILDGIEKEGGLKSADMGWRASYIYRWSTPLWRSSGALGDGRSVVERAREWEAHNQDDGQGAELTPADLTLYWKRVAQEIGKLWPDKLAAAWRALGLSEKSSIPPVAASIQGVLANRAGGESIQIPGMAEPVRLAAPGEKAPASPPVIIKADISTAYCCDRQPGAYFKVNGHWFCLRVEMKGNAVQIFPDQIAFCRGCHKPVARRLDEAAAPYSFGDDPAADKTLALLAHKFPLAKGA